MSKSEKGEITCGKAIMKKFFNDLWKGKILSDKLGRLTFSLPSYFIVLLSESSPLIIFSNLSSFKICSRFCSSKSGNTFLRGIS
jgi:hypothetical protein